MIYRHCMACVCTLIHAYSAHHVHFADTPSRKRRDVRKLRRHYKRYDWCWRLSWLLLNVIDTTRTVMICTSNEICAPVTWSSFFLTQLPRVPHLYIGKSGQHWFIQWLVAYSVPSHYLNQCWFIVNWVLRNKLRRTFNQNTNFFIHQNAKMHLNISSANWRPFCAGGYEFITFCWLTCPRQTKLIMTSGHFY